MEYTELRPGKKIIIDREPYEVVTYEFLRKQQRKAVVKTQLRNLISGRILQKSFQGSDSIEEANLETKPVQFLYRSGDDFFFMDTTSYDQFSLTKDQVGNAANYLVDGMDVDILMFGSRTLGIELPKKVNLKVTDTPPGVRGDTASTATKPATLETGYVVNVPLFINEGDVVRVNTETGEYVERAE